VTNVKGLKSGVALMLVLVLLTGCPSASKITTYLNMVAEGASAVVTALAASGVIDPAIAAKVTAYAKQASDLVIKVNIELASTTDNKAQQWTVIAGYFAAVILPNVPNAPASLATTIAILDAALVLLEGAIASSLGATPPASVTVKASRKMVMPPNPVGTTREAAVQTAKDTLARIASR
jgi:hypothetical protein